jgi:hypothetical protein
MNDIVKAIIAGLGFGLLFSAAYFIGWWTL